MKTSCRRLVAAAATLIPALALPALTFAATPVEQAAEAEVQVIDTNHNGKIAPAEHAAGAKKMFATMDANRDGKVTTAEMDSAQEKMVGGKKDERRDDDSGELTSAEKIRMIDTNRDGVLTATEHSEGAKRMFALMDLDTDGNLTRDEIVSGHQELLSKDDK